MIILQFTESEAVALEGAVARRVNEMMSELVHTSGREAHAELRTDYEELEKLQRQLKEQMKTAQPPVSRRLSSEASARR